MRGSEFPYGNYHIKNEVTYESNKYVKYEDLVYKLNPGVQDAGTYLLRTGDILDANSVLTMDDLNKLRAISIGDLDDGVSRWIACRYNTPCMTFTSWCSSGTVSYDTGQGYYSDSYTAEYYKDGKRRSNIILDSALTNGYDYTYFPALNYCYSYNFGIIGTKVGDGYLPAGAELRGWMLQPIVWTNWNKSSYNSSLPGSSSTTERYWSCMQKNAQYPYSQAAYNMTIVQLLSAVIKGGTSLNVLPMIQFS